MHAACKKGRKDIEEVLIRNKRDVHVISIFGRTALHEACSSDYTPVLDEEDDTWSSHSQEDDIWSSEGEEDDVQYDEPKVENGKNHNCNIHVLDSCGLNAFHYIYASERGSLEIVEILHDIGCKIGDLSASGKRILHAACSGGNEDIVVFFLNR
ncbi:unnamed protein product [Mytilus edulis]|uniref:Uncharacterized protein n=1 Tax=Mytilus edulis TaxID=6550 RepID=A0A8S3URC6_MYTED|nr:unnamed protein product [Mytilus edulis]